MFKYLSAILFAILWFSIHTYAFQQQWFAPYQEKDWLITANCTNQCVVLTEGLLSNDTLLVQWEVTWSWQIVWWYFVSNQVYPLANKLISGKTDVDINTSLTDNRVYDQIPKESPIIVVFQWSLQVNDLSIGLSQKGIFEKRKTWIISALQYVPYSPRTINFLEWPMWNGKYITERFFNFLLFFSLILIIWFYAWTKHNKKRILTTLLRIIAIFWLILDVFYTQQQIWLYHEVTSASPNDTTRLWRDKASAQYMQFVKNTVPKNAKAYVYAVYPFDIELKYRLYPDITVGEAHDSTYVVRYNPYGPKNPFNFVDPLISWNTVKIGPDTFTLIKQNIFSPQWSVLEIK